MNRDIFSRRVAFKPFEYPEILPYKDAIRHSYWLHTEWNFESDKHDFATRLNSQERNVIKNTLLAISQIEVSVKRFWTQLGTRFPKAEFDQIGVTFGESEVRHSDAYSHLLEVLGLNDDFELLLRNPVIQGRVEYLTKYLKNASDSSDENYTLILTLFSIFIENVSLFSQFAIIKAFNKYKNVLKDIDNIVQATQKEEVVHALLGVCIIKIIQEEKGEWFTEQFYEKVYRAAKKAFESECKILDWIFEEGELEFLPSIVLKEFVKQRLNESMELIGGEPIFVVDVDLLKELKWFTEEIYAETNVDFFHKKSVNYSKKSKSITEEDLF